jgi:glutamyl-tRNA reductase
VVLVDLATLGAASLDPPSAADRAASDAIVADEVQVFLSWLRGADVVPTVAALRARADGLADKDRSSWVGRRLRREVCRGRRASVPQAIGRIVAHAGVYPVLLNSACLLRM